MWERGHVGGGESIQSNRPWMIGGAGLKSVYRTLSWTEGQSIRMALDAAEIDATIEQENSHLLVAGVVPIIPLEVFVSDEDEAAAVEVIHEELQRRASAPASSAADEDTLTDEPTAPTTLCVSCGKEVEFCDSLEAADRICPWCGALAPSPPAGPAPGAAPESTPFA